MFAVRGARRRRSVLPPADAGPVSTAAAGLAVVPGTGICTVGALPLGLLSPLQAVRSCLHCSGASRPCMVVLRSRSARAARGLTAFRGVRCCRLLGWESALERGGRAADHHSSPSSEVPGAGPWPVAACGAVNPVLPPNIGAAQTCQAAKIPAGPSTSIRRRMRPACAAKRRHRPALDAALRCSCLRSHRMRERAPPSVRTGTVARGDSVPL